MVDNTHRSPLANALFQLTRINTFRLGIEIVALLARANSYAHAAENSGVMPGGDHEMTIEHHHSHKSRRSIHANSACDLCPWLFFDIPSLDGQ